MDATRIIEARTPESPAGLEPIENLAERIEAHAIRLLALARSLPADQQHIASERHERVIRWHRLLDFVLGTYPEAVDGSDALVAERVGIEAGAVVFVREGEYWSIGRQRQIRLRHSKGLTYLCTLLMHPGEELHALDLVMGSGGEDGPRIGAAVATIEALKVLGADNTLEALDGKATAAYKARLADLVSECAEAARCNDEERRAALEEEAAWLKSELAAAYGLGGRSRPGPTPSERARQSVSKAIRQTIARIGSHDAALGAHLTRAVRTGQYCVYDPDVLSGIVWRL